MSGANRSRLTAALADARTAAWHLRHGGLTAVRRWHRRRSGTVPGLHRASVTREGLLSYQPWPIPDAPLRRTDLRVAVILDDFSRLALGFEWQQVEITPGTWRSVLAAEPVDLLFVESAWHGNQDAWQYRLTGPQTPDPALRDLVAWCRDHRVPTVFWNKEDPTHYQDFLATAALFDHVFTTDAGRIPDYRRDLGHDRVAVLPFAAQPAIHNPVRHGAGRQERDIAFAGMYFAHRHPERREQMDLLLGAALQAGTTMEHGLEIYSRQLGEEPRYQFPEPYAEHVVGSLDYPQMLTAYRAHKVFLNVNTVVGSETMYSRRVLELLASGTPVVSTPSPAIQATFADAVHQVDEPEKAAQTIRALVRNAELRDRAVHRGQRTIWAQHTYAHRVDDILGATGLVEHQRTRAVPQVSALVVTRRPERLDEVLTGLAQQLGVELQVCLVTHGWAPPVNRLRHHREWARLEIAHWTAPPDLTLGECLNLAVEMADNDLVAKIDDDDLYGPHYLQDQASALAWSGADLVGKQAHYMYLAGPDLTVLRYPEREHRFTDRVSGPTLVTRRGLLRSAPFPPVSRGEDTGLLTTLSSGGASIYSTDRFGFVQVRSPGGSGHTWRADDVELLAGADIQVAGLFPEHAFV